MHTQISKTLHTRECKLRDRASNSSELHIGKPFLNMPVCRLGESVHIRAAASRARAAHVTEMLGPFQNGPGQRKPSPTSPPSIVLPPPRARAEERELAYSEGGIKYCNKSKENHSTGNGALARLGDKSGVPGRKFFTRMSTPVA